MARRYAGIAATIVIDRTDAALLEPIRALGMRVLVDDTVMDGADGERRLAASLLQRPKVGRWLMRRRSNSFAANPRGVLATYRRDGQAQLSPVLAGVDAEDRVVISTREGAMKTRNLRRNPRAASLRAQRALLRRLAQRGRQRRGRQPSRGDGAARRLLPTGQRRASRLAGISRRDGA